MNQPRIIVALDGMEINEALRMAQILSGSVWGFKINDLLLEAGTSIIPRLRRYGYVFCDPKLYDIPSTVANSVQKLARAGANIISVHATADIKLLMAAINYRGNSKIVGISTITSQEKASRKNLMLAAFNVLVSRADGIVLGTRNIKTLNQKPEYKKLIKIVPGVRPVWWNPLDMTGAKKDDQKRIATPREAFKAGADFLVIGRPITKSDSPLEAVERIKYEILNISTSLDINGERG